MGWWRSLELNLNVHEKDLAFSHFMDHLQMAMARAELNDRVVPKLH